MLETWKFLARNKDGEVFAECVLKWDPKNKRIADRQIVWADRADTERRVKAAGPVKMSVPA